MIDSPNIFLLQKQLPLKLKTVRRTVALEQQKRLSQRRVDHLKRAGKVRSLEIGKKVVNQENPGIMGTPRSLVTRALANGMRFQKSKVSAPRIHASHILIICKSCTNYLSDAVRRSSYKVLRVLLQKKYQTHLSTSVS